jgi:hypothetical protein
MSIVAPSTTAAPLVDVEDVRVQPHLGESLAEAVGLLPVSGRGPAVEQTGCRQREGADAQRCDACAPSSSAPAAPSDSLRRASRADRTRHDDGVPPTQYLQTKRAATSKPVEDITIPGLAAHTAKE